jgi:hypothetical protein
MVKNVLYYMAPTLDSAFIISASTLVIVTSPQEPRHCTTNVAPLHTMNDVLSRYIRSQSRWLVAGLYDIDCYCTVLYVYDWLYVL